MAPQYQPDRGMGESEYSNTFAQQVGSAGANCTIVWKCRGVIEACKATTSFLKRQIKRKGKLTDNKKIQLGKLKLRERNVKALAVFIL